VSRDCFHLVYGLREVGGRYYYLGKMVLERNS
jgi:hypothetical protein